MQTAFLDVVKTDPPPIDLPSIFYPEFEFSPPEPGSADSLPTFQVDTLSKADWAVAKILAAESRISRRAELAAELHSRIDTWLTKASSADQDSISYLTMLIRPFVEAELALQRRSRTLSLPSGSASLRRLPDRLELTDREAALAWCEEHAPEAIVIKKDLSKTELKKLVFQRNEPIPGIAAELGGEQIYIKATA